MSKRLDKLDKLFDLLKDQVFGCARDYSGGMGLGGGLIPGKTAIKGILPRIEELEETAQKVDKTSDVMFGRGEHRSDDYWTIIQEPKPGLVKDVAELTERVETLTGIVEQLAALHGKEIADFKPTTSEYGRILVDTKETDSDRPTQ